MHLTRDAKHIKKKLTELKDEIDNSTIIFEDSNNLLKYNYQKNNKEIENLNN